MVIKNISEIAEENNCKKAATSIINYYTSNINKMDYKAYKTIGAGIILWCYRISSQNLNTMSLQTIRTGMGYGWITKYTEPQNCVSK